MKKILVLGGTRFFGKRLVEVLIEEGFNITIATRGITPHLFGDRVQQIIVDRTDTETFKEIFENTSWDIVFDNICYSPNEALAACEVFKGKTKKYIFTSTLSVYDEILGKELTEEDFNPYTYNIRYGNSQDFSYGEGKRLAEAVFFQQASFPVVAVRFPIVLGLDDYTRRLHDHIERVIKGEPIHFISMNARMSFISSEDAAKFLKFALLSDIEGPFNVTSSGTVSMQELMGLIEKAVGKQAKIVVGKDNERTSPFSLPDDWYMSQEKSIKAGFTCEPLNDWLPTLINEITKQCK
ncbi:nucleoside-diphosphate-sugar epimerase [Ureibacillus xyleni]|uniref:Nucleoside-diphosphate-sugar epimerase n=1 Tax=Ureibacillus xyleni TaxID=614648 RepID=A0A285S5S8_9BACL|nr:NAD-dependent epimerase/dehydratase family protein [Ureibacillus xyleni]SOC02685.1 nucleoside-diphosphate-sugar epimerase [Ureibacillus xyleni]